MSRHFDPELAEVIKRLRAELQYKLWMKPYGFYPEDNQRGIP
jgi:hypothetical protein